MSEELKPNQCTIHFVCDGSLPNRPCVYRKGDNCWYNDCLVCNSSVARVNAMVIELKRLGFVATDETQKSLLKDIRALLQKSLDSGHGWKPVEDAVELIDSILD